MSALSRCLFPLALLGCARGEPFREPPLATARGAAGQFVPVESASPGVRAASPLAQAVPRRLGGDVRALRVSPDGARVLTLEAQGVARVWDLAPLRERSRREGVVRLHEAPGGRYLVLERAESPPELFDFSAGVLRARLGSQPDAPTRVLFCGGAVVLLFSGLSLGAWRLEDGRELVAPGSSAPPPRSYGRRYPFGSQRDGGACAGSVLTEYAGDASREWDLSRELPTATPWRGLHPGEEVASRPSDAPQSPPEPAALARLFPGRSAGQGLALTNGRWAVERVNAYQEPDVRSPLPWGEVALLGGGGAPALRLRGRILGATLDRERLFTAEPGELHVYNPQGTELAHGSLSAPEHTLEGLYEGGSLAVLSFEDTDAARAFVLEVSTGAWLGQLSQPPRRTYGSVWPSQRVLRPTPAGPWLWRQGEALYWMPGAEARASLLPPWRTASPSRDGARACLLGGDGTARLVEVASGRVLRSFPGRAVVCDRTRALTVERGVARVWDLAAEAPLGSFAAPLFLARALFLAEDARLLTLERAEEGHYLARVRDGRTGAPLWTQGELTNAGNVFAFDDARSVGLFTERDWVTSLIVVDAVTARPTMPPLAHVSTSYSAAGFAPVVLDNGFRCDAVSLRTGARLWTARAPCNELRWLPPHRMALAVHSYNYSVTAVDTRTGQTLATLRDEGRFPAQSASGAPWATLLRAAGVAEGEVSLRYADHSEHAVVGLRGDTQQWLTGGSQVSAPAGLLLPLLGEDEHFVVLDPASGRLLDYAFGATAPSAQSEPLRPPSAALFDEDRHALYLAQPGGALLSLDARTLRVRWRATLPAEGQALGALSEQGRSLLLRTEGGLYAVETERGAVRPLLEGGVFDLGQTRWLGARVLVATPAGGLLLDGR